MFEQAFTFAVNYFSNPDKVLKDRTGTKQRGLGQILDDQIIGKLVEYGVCKILEQNCVRKEILPDKEVKSEFDFGQPDVIGVKENGDVRPPTMFVEIKNSPRKYQWIGVYESQFDAAKVWFQKNNISQHQNDKIFIIYASLYDKFGDRVTSGNTSDDGSSDWLTDTDQKRIDATKDHLISLIVDEIKCDSETAEKIVTGDNLSDSEKKLFNSLEQDSVTAIKNFKNLKLAFKKRKEDILGSFLNYIFSKIPGRSNDLSFFFKPDDFSVGIDFVVSGTELDPGSGSGKLFLKNEIWPSPVIFEEKKIFSASGKPGNGKTMFKENTTKILRQELIDNQTNSEPYPSQFGDIVFSVPVDVYCEKKITRRDGNSYELKTLYVNCDEDTVAKEVLLGEFSIKGENRILIKNILEGKKDRSDYAIPKRNYDSIVSEKTVERVKRIAENI